MAYPSSVDLASLGAIFNLKALHTVLWALSFGINIWNGVVGVNAFKAIPRLTFRQLQGKLFPVYFNVMSSIALLLVASQLFHHLPRQSLKEFRKPDSLQALVVLTHLGAHVYNGFSLGPRVVDVMRDRAKQEKAEGKSCTDADISPALKHLNSEFKMLHGQSSAINLFAFLLSTFHGLWIATYGV